MPLTDTSICNLALGMFGETRIMDMNESSAAARACALWYAPTRKAVLRMHKWNFATRRDTLTELVTTPLFGWAHQFQLPDDCMYVVSLNESDEGDIISAPYTIEGRKLLTDADECNLVYIIDETNPDEWDSLFVDVISQKLAIRLCDFLRGSSGKSAELIQEYTELIKPLGQRVDSNESRGNKGRATMAALNSEFVRARSGGL